MKILITILISLLNLSTLSAATSWENPPVMCPEEILPKGLNCPDLTQVENPYTDFSNETKEEIKDWIANKAADLKLCRNLEVLRREELKAGSFSPATIELAWMTANGGQLVAEKLAAIDAASTRYEIPAQILMGALKQESLISSLGISPDGGNYSCGLAQLSIQEWCESMNGLSPIEKTRYDWPSDISCDSETLPTEIVKPLYDIAVQKLGNRPKYQLTAEDFSGITAEEVEGSFPAGNNLTHSKRFQAVKSFVNNCQNISLSIDFKAKTLRGLFDNFVPQNLKNAEIYTEGKTFSRTCQQPYKSKYYPLHTGWLLAVAMYNAGPVQAKLVGSYYQVKNYDKFPAINPLDLIEALHWGGKYSRKTDGIVFKDQDKRKYSQSWFKSCIVQRHVARVIQHATLPIESIAKSLEQGGCTAKGVPDYRKSSSGVKEN